MATLVQKRKDLDRLSQPHVVGQATAKAEFVEKMQPAESFALIGPQFTDKRPRFPDRRHSLKHPQLLAEPGKSPIDGDVLGLLRSQQDVEEGGLCGQEPDPLTVLLT